MRVQRADRAVAGLADGQRRLAGPAGQGPQELLPEAADH